MAYDIAQAHRLITRAAVTAARVFGRAFAEAYKQANASAQYKKANPGSAAATGSGHAGKSLCLCMWRLSGNKHPKQYTKD